MNTSETLSLDDDSLTPHPSAEKLALFLNGRMGESESRKIQSHIDSCVACKNQLERLTVDTDGPVSVDQSSVTDESANARSTAQGTHESLEEIAGYRIVGELGRGGMGAVYRAFDQRLKRYVALKVVLSKEHASNHERERFRVEAESIAKVQHEGIVQIFEVGEYNGCPFMVLELVNGQPLTHHLDGKPKDVRWAAIMLLQLARATSVAHKHGVVHRDLKPDNILLVDPSRSTNESDTAVDHVWDHGFTSGEDQVAVPIAKITDFGLAREINSDQNLTRPGAVLGTPAYMAPEQAGSDVNLSAPTLDIHALGAILYELLTGESPFYAPDLHTSLAILINDDPIPPRQQHRQIPRDLETICLKCLMKKPEARYATAEDLATDLELFLRGEPIKARVLSVKDRIDRWARQKPILAISCLIAPLAYGLHLFLAMTDANSMHNQKHAMFTGIAAGIVAISIGVQWLLDHGYRELGRITFLALTICLMTAVACVTRGPQSLPFELFPSLIVVTATLSPRVRSIWGTATMCALGWGYVNYHAWKHQTKHAVGLESIIAFLLGIMAVALTTQLVVRRLHTPVRAKNSAKSSDA